MSRIKNLIRQGENLHLDFKQEITDAKKIAKSLVAFANTDGGTLLVGVKDNGVIHGIKSDEEYYMMEAAGHLFCIPEIKFQSKTSFEDNKEILEIIVEASKQKPHFAKHEDGSMHAYIRIADKNLEVNDIQLKVWELEKNGTGIKLEIGETEKFLLRFLEEKKIITFSRFIKSAKINRRKAKQTLIKLISMNIVDIVFTGNITYYKLNRNYKYQIQ